MLDFYSSVRGVPAEGAVAFFDALPPLGQARCAVLPAPGGGEARIGIVAVGLCMRVLVGYRFCFHWSHLCAWVPEDCPALR